MAKRKGYVIYEGPGNLTSDPVVAILTMNSVNVKTGDMPQLWFFSQGEKPTTAAKSGSDNSVCGDCAFRPILAKNLEQAACYVNLGQAPNNIWNAWKVGNYDKVWPEVLDRPVRFGAYGDPASVPLTVIQRLAKRCSAGWTGYTHQWRRRPGLRPYCMASVDNAREQAWAQRKGWRTFRVIQKDDGWPHPIVTLHRLGLAPYIGEIVCPAANEAGNRTTCFKCRLCNGKRGEGDLRKHIVINAH